MARRGPCAPCRVCARRHRAAHRRELIYNLAYVLTWIVLWHIRAIRTTWRKLT